VREILDIFAAELIALEQVSVEGSNAPEILDCAHSVLRALRYRFELRGVSFELLLSPPSSTQWKVVGQRDRLERILYNLLENALRHSPSGAVVSLRLEDEGPAIRVSVLDQRTSGETEVWVRDGGPRTPGSRLKGRASLGWVFCRTMVHRWGGEVGQEPGPRGGHCTWFRLAKPTGSARNSDGERSTQ
jgi:signal transduction histidine kinase